MSKKKSELKEVKVSEALTPEESKKYEVWAENRKRVTKLEEDETLGQVRVVKDNGFYLGLVLIIQSDETRYLKQ